MRELLLLLVAGCTSAPEPAIRDIRPTKIERGVRVVVEGRGFAPGEATVVLEGKFVLRGGRERAGRIEASGRAVAPDRVIFDADEEFERRVGRADFRGTVTVVQGDRRFASLARAPFELELFPPSLRQLAYGLVHGRNTSRLLGWLGMDLRAVAGGLQVVRVTDKFDAVDFLREFDRPPLDARVSKAEAGPRWAEFAALDRDGDGHVDRFEAEAAEHEEGFAAREGIRPGDVIVAAAGQPVPTVDELVAHWREDLPGVDVTLQRGPDKISATLPRYGAPYDIPEGLLLAGIPIAACLLLLALLGPFSGLVVVAERRIAGRMQSRIGPNRVGPQGLLQWLADGIKLIVKEDIVPTDCDPVLFRASPYLVWVGIFATFVVLPFSQAVIVADMNIGLLYLLSITALVVVGIIMGGWASNSKWALLGGMRSAAQIISYEVPAALALLTVVLLAGTLSPQGIVRAQGGAPWSWNLFDNPFVFGAFFIYFASALAEGNRTPFDLPEAESELVSGYNTEYSGFRFAVYFLSEWTNLYVIAAVATTVFLGGWRLPLVSPQRMEASLLLQLAGFAAFFIKALALVFVIIWVRWTVPRFRVDQMMALCWKYFIPLTFASFLGTALWMWIAPPWARVGMRLLMFAVFGVALTAVFARRVLYNMRNARRRLWDISGALTPPS
jgi:NADH:ubiquinone oxidoreductase subunit H